MLSSLLVNFGLWLAKLGGWAAPACARRHWAETDQVELDRISRRLAAELSKPDCTERHFPECREHHWDGSDQAVLDDANARIVAWQERALRQWPTLSPAIVERATALAADAENKYPSGYGEAKRHDVYARLTKEFPQTARRNIGLAVELSLP